MTIAPETPPDIASHVREAVAAALDKKAEDLVVLHLEPVTDFTDYFLLANGTSDRHVDALAEAILRRLRGTGVRPLHVEGRGRSSWVLLDFGDFLVHLFDGESRELYSLDRLWGDAPDVTAQFAA